MNEEEVECFYQKQDHEGDWYTEHRILPAFEYQRMMKNSGVTEYEMYIVPTLTRRLGNIIDYYQGSISLFIRRRVFETNEQASKQFYADLGRYDLYEYETELAYMSDNYQLAKKRGV